PEERATAMASGPAQKASIGPSPSAKAAGLALPSRVRLAPPGALTSQVSTARAARPPLRFEADGSASSLARAPLASWTARNADSRIATPPSNGTRAGAARERCSQRRGADIGVSYRRAPPRCRAGRSRARTPRSEAVADARILGRTGDPDARISFL